MHFSKSESNASGSDFRLQMGSGRGDLNRPPYKSVLILHTFSVVIKLIKLQDRLRLQKYHQLDKAITK